MKRGEIYFVERGYEQGSEQRAGRPAIIVSNNKNNDNSNVVEVVYLTTQPKQDLPTHVDIRSAPKGSIALCEQITSVFVDRIGDYIGECTDYEMVLVDAALAISLGLNFEAPKKEKEEKAKVVERPTDNATREEVRKLETDIVRISAERDTYKTLYEGMFVRVIDVVKGN